MAVERRLNLRRSRERGCYLLPELIKLCKKSNRAEPPPTGDWTPTALVRRRGPDMLYELEKRVLDLSGVHNRKMNAAVCLCSQRYKDKSQ